MLNLQLGLPNEMGECLMSNAVYKSTVTVRLPFLSFGFSANSRFVNVWS